MEIQIGQDIRKFKTKDIGGFSFKEAGFLAAGAASFYLVYKFAGSYELGLFPASIFLALGFLKPYGMTCIQFFRTVMKENLSPQCYINQTDFEYNEDDIKADYPDVVIPAEWSVIQTNTTAKINKQDKLRYIK